MHVHSDGIDLWSFSGEHRGALKPWRPISLLGHQQAISKRSLGPGGVFKFGLIDIQHELLMSEGTWLRRVLHDKSALC